ncbi:hypothetical protein ACHAPT_012623 [Fusarium lateritium]
MKPCFATCLMLLSLAAGSIHNHSRSLPECATACSRGLFRYRFANQYDISIKAACNDMAQQRELFLCLASSCGEDYGPALAYTISACYNYGALITNLLPVELHHVSLAQRRFSSLTPRSDTGRFAFDKYFTLAVDCTAGSNGILTLSLPESAPSGIPQSPATGDSPLVPGSGGGDPNLGSSPPPGNAEANIGSSPSDGNTDSNLGSEPGDPSRPDGGHSGAFANTASNGVGGNGSPVNGANSSDPAGADCSPEDAGSPNDSPGAPNSGQVQHPPGNSPDGSSSSPDSQPNGQPPSQPQPQPATVPAAQNPSSSTLADGTGVPGQGGSQGTAGEDCEDGTAPGPGSGLPGNSSPQSPPGSPGNPIDCSGLQEHLYQRQQSPLRTPRTQKDAPSELMVRLTVVLRQVLQFSQHHKLHQHPALHLFLHQAKVTPTAPGTGLPHAPSLVSLQQHQHHLQLPAPALALKGVTLQQTQELHKTVHLQQMEVVKTVSTQVAVAVLLKRHLDHNHPFLRLDLHHLLYPLPFQVIALEIQGILLVLPPVRTVLTQEPAIPLPYRHLQVLLQLATQEHLRRTLDHHLHKEDQILPPMEMVPHVMEVLVHALVTHQPPETDLSLMARSLQTACHLRVLATTAVRDPIQHKTTTAPACLRATATARRALAVVNHLTLGLHTLLSTLQILTTASRRMILKFLQTTTAKDRTAGILNHLEILRHQFSLLQ